MKKVFNPKKLKKETILFSDSNAEKALSRDLKQHLNAIGLCSLLLSRHQNETKCNFFFFFFFFFFLQNRARCVVRSCCCGGRIYLFFAPLGSARSWRDFRVGARWWQLQGCQILLVAAYQMEKNIPGDHKIYQIAHKMFQVAI
jgi:hypothetical protein